MFNAFWKGNTALAGFKEAITNAWKKRAGENRGKGFVKGIDGRKIWIRSEHSVVNAYFQSTGSIVVKTAIVILDKLVRDAKLNAHQVIVMHDECEYECSQEDADKLCELTEIAFREAGERLGIRVPITASPKLGKNWREVH